MRETLPVDDPLHALIEHRFTTSVLSYRGPRPGDPHREPPHLVVTRIEKILNPRLQELYLAEVQDVAGLCQQRVAPIQSLEHCRVTSYTGLDMNEFLLFHGAKSDIIERLSLQGLDPRFAGENAGALFGQGTHI